MKKLILGLILVTATFKPMILGMNKHITSTPLKLAKVILDKESQPNASSSEITYTILEELVHIVEIPTNQKDNIEAIDLLVEKLNKQDKKGTTVMLSHVVNPINDETNNGFEKNLLIQATKNGNPQKVMELLKEPDININIQDEYGMPALGYAAYNGNPEIVTQLLKRKEIDVNQQDNFGRTALIYAAYVGHKNSGHKEILTQLLKVPAIDINKKDANGKTALTWARQNMHAERITELLKHPKIEDNIKKRKPRQCNLL